MQDNHQIKVLVVCSGNAGYISPFVVEQANSLIKLGFSVDYFLIQGKGIFGYLKNYPKYKKKIKAFNPDIIHAHYGLSGMFAILQKKVPVVTTFHGTDINPTNKIGHSPVKRINIFTKIALKLSAYKIFVSEELFEISNSKKNSSIIPCGVDMSIFTKQSKVEARKSMKLETNKKYILFSSSFENQVKNYPLAKKALDLIDDVTIIEMKGMGRKDVSIMLSACDALLVTSINESGPLVVKEAMACGCPIVSTDVGDVKWVIGETEGCFITTFEPTDVAEKIKLAIKYSEEKERIVGRDRIFKLGIDLETIGVKVANVYKTVLDKK